MAEDKDAKTEPPTARRRIEARNNGQVARSQDLAASVLLIGALVMLRFIGPDMWNRLLSIYRTALSAEGAGDRNQLIPLATASALEMFRMVAPFMALMVVLTLVAVCAQVGLLWTLKPLVPNIKKLNPISGFGRIFSARSVVQLVQNLAKLAVVGTVTYWAIRDQLDQIIFALSP